VPHRRIDVHVIAINAGLKLATSPQPRQNANPSIRSQLNTGQAGGRVGIILTATGSNGADRERWLKAGRVGSREESEFFVQDEIAHTQRPRALVPAIRRHPPPSPVDLNTVERRLVGDLMKIGLVEYR